MFSRHLSSPVNQLFWELSWRIVSTNSFQETDKMLMGIHSDLSCHSLIMPSLPKVLIPFPCTPELHFLEAKLVKYWISLSQLLRQQWSWHAVPLGNVGDPDLPDTVRPRIITSPGFTSFSTMKQRMLQVWCSSKLPHAILWHIKKIGLISLSSLEVLKFWFCMFSEKLQWNVG